MASTPLPQNDGPEVMMMKKGDIVWVLTGNQHEEPATVLATNCSRPVILTESSNSSSSSSSSDNDIDENEEELANDGILVRFHVSNIKKVFPPDKVRPFATAETSAAAALSSSTSTSASTTTTAAARPPRRSTRRSVVTPSPNAEKVMATGTAAATAVLAAEADSPPVEEKKPPAKRKATATTAASKDEEQQEENEDDKDDSVKMASPYFAKRRPVAAGATARKKEANGNNKKTAAPADLSFIINGRGTSFRDLEPVRKHLTSLATTAATRNSNDDLVLAHQFLYQNSQHELVQKQQQPQGQGQQENNDVILGHLLRFNGYLELYDDDDVSDEEILKRDEIQEAEMAFRAHHLTVAQLNKLCDVFVLDRSSKKNKKDNNNKDDLIELLLDFLGAPNAQALQSSSRADNDDDDGNDDDDADMFCLPVGRPLPAAAAAAAVAAAARNDSSGEEEDEDEDEDLPYVVEYSPTGRATCRRCDEVIAKGNLRISHQPVFRGKPGFRVYRHLQCALFDEKILSATDVGGWRKLSTADYQALQDRVDEARLELQKEEEELQPDELVPTVFTGETRKAPPGFSGNLLPFQVEGLSWMRHQEVNVPEIRGGILADEMGMGKTIQTICTILDNRTLLQHSKVGAKHDPSSPDLEARKAEEALWQTSVDEWKIEMNMLNVPPKMWPKKTIAAARAGTLVVCPVIALNQWKTEIEKFTVEPDKTLTVAIYHGPNRAKDLPPEKMRHYDVILTTYQVLEQDFRKMVSPNKVTCPNCKNKFKADKLRVHLKYFCGAGAERTEAQARQRRAGENRNRRGGNNGGGGGAKSKKDFNKTMSKKAPPMTKAASAKKPAAKAKKTVRARSTADYESDSELTAIESEEDEPVMTTSKRPSRSAAKKAIAKVSASIAEWGDESHPRRGKAASNKKRQDDDDSSFASDSDDDEDSNNDSSGDDESTSGDDDDDDVPMESLAKITPAARKKSSSSNDDAVARAREKQRQALANAKKRKMTKSKAEPKPKKAKAEKSKPTKRAAKGKGKKKFGNSSSDDSSDDDDGDDEVMKADPMDDIDLEKLMKEAMAGARFSVLHSFSWWRVVLDEAHMIKSRSSQTAAAAFSLTGIHRWCLSGTPLQNRVGELYSLIRFLRIDPMAHYFCKTKGCNCKNLHYRIKNGKCQDCGHRGFSHFAHFNKHVLNVIQRDGYSGDGRRAMFTLKNEVLDKCLLRRTKETRAEDMNLPPRIVTIRTVRLHPIEEDFYNALYTQTRSSFDDYVAEGTVLNNYAHIFDLLTKMRQAVGHPYCVVFSKTNSKRLLEQQQSASANVANGSVDCDICHEPFTERVVTSCCGAGFCRSCVIEYLAGTGGASTPCPSCNNPLSVDLNQASTAPATAVDDEPLTVSSGTPSNGGSGSSGNGPAMPSLKDLPHIPSGSILRRINLADFTTSTKIEVLVQELIEMRQQRPGSKCLVFSQFVNMLDLVRWRLHSDPFLQDMGLGVRILHGGMDVKSREATLQDFREDKDVRILLMSLKSGGVALNLTVASEVYLMDNWWNPAAEAQAIDRTHRLGQHRPIRAVRFIAEGTVEERVLQLQEKKRMVFDGTVGRDAGSLKALSVTDMKALFT